MFQQAVEVVKPDAVAPVKFLETVRIWLDTNVGAGAAFAALCVAVFLFVYAFRKLAPNAWIWLVKRVPYIDFQMDPLLALLDKVVQTIPGGVFAGLTAWLSTGADLTLKGFWVALLGSLASPLMAIAHHILAAIPWIPYLGKLGRKAKRRFTPAEGTPVPNKEDSP
jgi:cobalamin synthase